MKGRPVDCKVNVAAYIKINMPAIEAGMAAQRATSCHNILIKTRRRLKKMLDNALGFSIIIFTNTAASHRGCRCRKKIPNSKPCGDREL